MSENKKPNWDKITEGKIRHGFAVAAFESRMKLTEELASQINEWVRYVVDGHIVHKPQHKKEEIKPVVNKSASGHISNSLTKIMPKNIVEEVNEQVKIESIIKDKVKELSQKNRDVVLKSLENGEINKDNLDICLERINALVHDKK